MTDRAPPFERKRGAALGLVLALVFAGISTGGCASEPCVGSSCPSACLDPTCAATDAAPSSSGSGGGSGRFTACSSDVTCDTPHGFSCVAGACRHACHTHFDCAGAGTCETLSVVGQGLVGAYCAPLSTPIPTGEYYTRCPAGTECSANEGFVCLGSGLGDLDSYCSAPCASDEECPAGLLCDRVRVSETESQNYCVRRGFCASCENDADCLSYPDQICARDQSGEKVCTRLCDPGVDSCPWGGSTECGVWDTTLGVPTCAHRFGSCHGSGKSCEPCVRAEDCPSGFCTRSSFTGERWCIDLDASCSCEGLRRDQGVCSGANGCPTSPGGLKMLCYDDPQDQTSTVAKHCFAGDANGAMPLASQQSGCWSNL